MRDTVVSVSRHRYEGQLFRFVVGSWGVKVINLNGVREVTSSFNLCSKRLWQRRTSYIVVGGMHLYSYPDTIQGIVTRPTRYPVWTLPIEIRNWFYPDLPNKEWRDLGPSVFVRNGPGEERIMGLEDPEGTGPWERFIFTWGWVVGPFFFIPLFSEVTTVGQDSLSKRRWVVLGD